MLQEAMRQNISFMDIEEAASKIRDEFWGDSIPIDPARVAVAMEIHVLAGPLEPDMAGALIKNPGQDPRIVINGADSPNRKRFTCAHEIGHFVTQTAADDEYEYVDLRGSFSFAEIDSGERHANAFAAALLAPEKHVRRMRRKGLKAIEMASRFGIPREAMLFRLANLGLL
jgi:Zn-dependent peptidase ImmA (M78 family)